MVGQEGASEGLGGAAKHCISVWILALTGGDAHVLSASFIAVQCFPP